MRKYLPVLQNASLLILSVACALLIGEAVLRLMMPRNDIAEWYQADPVYHHLLKPDFFQRYTYRGFGISIDVRTNANGFRDDIREVPVSGVTKVLFLGDSYVFGYGLNVDERMDTALRALAAHAEHHIETINWGVPGWGTRHQMLYAVNHLESARPEVLVLVFCNNDPANDRGVGLPALPDKESLFYPLKNALRRWSHLYRLLLEWRASSRIRSEMGQDAVSPDDFRPDGTPHAITPEEWEQTSEYMLRIYRHLINVNPDANMLILPANPEDTVVHEQLMSIAENGERLHYLDLKAHIAPLSEEERRMPWDAHWSPEMHHAVARSIYDWILTQGT